MRVDGAVCSACGRCTRLGCPAISGAEGGGAMLIDEALSAGDAAFKEKAAAKISELMSSARTIILVSHALGTVEDLCNEAILLDHGRLVVQGGPAEVIDRYNSGLRISSATREDL